MLDTGWVIQSKNTEDVTGFENSSRLLDELNHPILLSNQGHDHLHDFNFSESLALLHIFPTIDQKLNQLSRRRSSELRWIALLLKKTCHIVNTQTSCTNVLLPVYVVTATAKKD